MGSQYPQRHLATQYTPWMRSRLIAVALELRRSHGDFFARVFLEDLGILEEPEAPKGADSAPEATAASMLLRGGSSLRCPNFMWKK